VAGRDQSSADAGVKADLLVDGAAIGLEGAGIRSIFEYGAGCTSPSALSGPAPPLQCPTPGNRNSRANSCVRRREGWRPLTFFSHALSGDRFVADSPLEGRVRSEPVSEMGFFWAGNYGFGSKTFMDDVGSGRALFSGLDRPNFAFVPLGCFPCDVV
jgi:hypothetical protein